MRGMELMGYLSNSSTLDSIHLINKKHIGNLMINNTRIWIQTHTYYGRPVVDPDNVFFLLHGLRTHNGTW